MTTNAAPRGLKGPGKALWQATVAEFELSSPELGLLAEACRTRDELERLTIALAGAELLVIGSMGQPRPNPLLDEARKHRETMGRLLALLRPVEDEPTRGRPAARVPQPRRIRDAS